MSAKNIYEEEKLSTSGTEWNKFDSAKQTMMDIEEKVKKFEEENPDKKTQDNEEYQSLKISETIARRNLDIATIAPSKIGDKLSIAKANYLTALANYNSSRDGIYKSPIDGVVENLGVNEDQNVIAGVGDKEGTPLFLIIPEGNKTVSMQIGPSDAMALQVGQKATLTNDYVKDASFSAQVVRVDKVGKSGDVGLTYRAWLEFSDPDNKLLLGIPVEISMIVAEKNQILTLPKEAVNADNLVTIVDDQGEILEEKKVEIGLKAKGSVEIVNGLNEGEKVLIDRNKESYGKK